MRMDEKEIRKIVAEAATSGRNIRITHLPPPDRSSHEHIATIKAGAGIYTLDDAASQLQLQYETICGWKIIDNNMYPVRIPILSISGASLI
jgi:hypothetical protein